MRRAPVTLLRFLAAAVLLCLSVVGSISVADNLPQAASDDNLSYAICPIVYPLDQTPSERGFRYTFYGNAFFVNSDGYLLTAAHVLSQLSGVDPYILVRLPMAPPRLVRALLIASDPDHDVALLRASPNPFEGKYQVKFLSLAVQRPARMQSVFAAALRPSRLKDPHTFDAFVEDWPSGEVLNYEFWQIDKGRAETELLLFNHDVLLGDSGAPLLSTDGRRVSGLIEGRWLRADAAALATATPQKNSGVGAAVPIHYAIPLLQQQELTWHEAAGDDPKSVPATSSPSASPTPEPISLIGASHPSQALRGGQVVLDATVNACGQVDDVHVVQGHSPFLERVLSTVRTWSFQPYAGDPQHSPDPRLGIVFQFASPGFSPGHSPLRRYQVTAQASADRAAVPEEATELEPAAKSDTEAAVILILRIDGNGKPVSTVVFDDPQSLAGPLLAAIDHWQFAAGKCGNATCNSTVILVVIPRLAESGP
jgi:S1-C subfamily serine protease